MNSRRWIALCGSTAILAGGALALAVTGPFGTPPRVVPYGGTLEQNGRAVNGQVPMTFYVLTSPTAPLTTALWSEDYPASSPVDVFGGRFQVSLGSHTPTTGIPDTVFQNGELYVGVKVAGVELGGRQRLLSSPFAVTSTQAKDFTVNGALRVNGPATVTGTLTASAAVSVAPTTDASQGLRVTGGSNSNIVVQPLVGGAFQAVNFNGYYSGGEQRFNTAKQRWRLAVDQRGTTDRFSVDRWDGTNGQAVLQADDTGNVALRGALTRVSNYCASASTCTATCPGSSTIVQAWGLHGADTTTDVVHAAGVCGRHMEWKGTCLGGTSCSVTAGCTSAGVYLLCANQL